MAKISISIYIKGDYEEIAAVWLRKTNPIQVCPERSRMEPITNAGSGADWIPAFAGMTNTEALYVGNSKVI